MKKDLIEILFKEFSKDKETIKKNLLQVMDTIVLETKDKYGSLTMTIQYTSKKEREYDKNNK
jgi:hypothetical protein